MEKRTTGSFLDRISNKGKTDEEIRESKKPVQKNFKISKELNSKIQKIVDEHKINFTEFVVNALDDAISKIYGNEELHYNSDSNEVEEIEKILSNKESNVKYCIDKHIFELSKKYRITRVLTMKDFIVEYVVLDEMIKVDLYVMSESIDILKHKVFVVKNSEGKTEYFTLNSEGIEQIPEDFNEWVDKIYSRVKETLMKQKDLPIPYLLRASVS